jgi:hypothetical protein
VIGLKSNVLSGEGDRFNQRLSFTCVDLSEVKFIDGTVIYKFTSSTEKLKSAMGYFNGWSP